jgi:hypothetical protein
MDRNNILGSTESIVSIEDFLDTYDLDSPNGQRFSKEGINILGDLEILPLTFRTPKIFDINILASWFFYSGCIGNRFNSSLHIPPQHKKILEKTVKTLGTKLKDSSARKNIFNLSKNRVYFSRLLHCAGVPQSQGDNAHKETKSKMELKLLPYISFLANKYTNIRGNDRKIAIKLLADHCKVLLLTRLTPNYSQFKLNFFKDLHSTTVEEAQYLPRQIVDIFNIIYPKIGLVADEIKVRKVGEGYEPSISFKQEQIMNASKYYGLFELNVNVNQQFHSLGRSLTFKNK